MTPWVQTRVVEFFTRQIERQTGTEISIGRVNFRPIESLVLEDVLIKDARKDTLLFCKRLVTKVDSVSFVKRRFTVTEMGFEKALFNLWVTRGKEGGVTNIELWLDVLSNARDTLSSSVTSASPLEWNVNLSKVYLKDCRFKYAEDEYEPEEYGINWTDVDCRKLDVVISDIDFSGGRYGAYVSGLTLEAKSGFRLLNLSARILAEDDQLLITKGLIQTERSELYLDTLQYNWVPNERYWHFFTQKMKQRYVFSPSTLHFDDLAYFNGELLGMNNIIVASGEVSSTVNRLEGRRLEIYLGEKSVIKGEFNSIGLPRFWETDFDITFRDSRIASEELEGIYMPWLESHYVKLPDLLHKYRTFDLEGNFKGRIEDFILTAKSETPGLLGSIGLTYKPDTVAGHRYHGSFRFYHVDYGFLTGQSYLGNGSYFGKYTGYLRDSSSAFTLNSRIGHVNLFHGSVRNIALDVHSDNGYMKLSSFVENDSIQARVALDYTYGGDAIRLADVSGELHVRHWDSWNTPVFGERESFGFRFFGNYEQRNEDAEVKLSVSDLSYENVRGKFTVDSIRLDHKKIEDYGLTDLRSSMADVRVEGFYAGLTFEDFVDNLICRYIPAYRYAVDKALRPGTNFICEAALKEISPVLKVIYPELTVSDGTSFSCDFNDYQGSLRVRVEADTLRWGDMHLYHSKIRAIGDSSTLQCIYTADELKYKRIGRLYNVRNVTNIKTNDVDNALSWGNWEKETYSGSLSANLRLMKYHDRYITQVFVNPGTIVMADSVWQVERALLLKEDKNIFVNNFVIYRGDQRFSLQGKIGSSPRDTLTVSFDNFDLAEFNRIIFDNKVKLFGKVVGRVNVSDFYKDRLVYANVDVNRWGINQDTLGTMKIRSFWDAPGSALQMQVSDQIGDQVPLFISGYYKPSSDSIDINMSLSGIDMKYVSDYFPDLIKKGSGSVFGDLSLAGTMEDAKVNGFLGMDTVSFALTGLNTDFSIDDRIQIRDNRILLDRFAIRDAASNEATCAGYYDIGSSLYDVNVQLKNFMVLNTRMEQGESFYGQLYISGLTRMHNLNGPTNFAVNIKTEPHSKIYVPLTSATSENSGQFLHFMGNERSDTLRRPLEFQHSLADWVDLNANLEINNNLEVQIIFDPTIGDILKTVGSGDIRVSLDKDRQLNVFGEYKIEKGDYLFTLSNLVNKKFILTPGGSIKWNGSLDDAIIDMSAVYHLKTSLNDLLSGMEKGTTKVPVECVLNLKENLMNPSVNFSINFPSLDAQMKSLIQSLFASQDDINKQMFSLLILNKFYTPDYVDKLEGKEERSAGYQVGVTTASELLSNQLSRWFSQISNNFDIGFSYRPGDEVTTNEFELALSTQIWNNRVTISANGNVVEKAKTTSNSPITGDFDVDVKINKQGTLKLKAYSHTDEKITYNATETVQGVGISYQETFDTFKELLRKYFGFFKRKKTLPEDMQTVDNKVQD